jgi:hypothetical protein
MTAALQHVQRPEGRDYLSLVLPPQRLAYGLVLRPDAPTQHPGN